MSDPVTPSPAPGAQRLLLLRHGEVASHHGDVPVTAAGLATAAAASPFFGGFVSAADGVGWWLRHPEPPGDDARCVLRRITAFARSLADLGADAPEITVAVTHSPVLRACALPVLGDPGEPAWVAGLQLHVTPEREVQISRLQAPATV